MKHRLVKILAALAVAITALVGVTSPAQASDRTWNALSAGTYHVCAIRSSSHTLYCWGSNQSGQLGTGNTDEHNAPTRVGSSSWSAVSGGQDSTCGLHETHTLYCWGENDSGQLGTGDLNDHNAPVQVGSSEWSNVDVGDSHTCAIRTSHTLYCWGSGSNGELGDGTYADHVVPSRVGTQKDWTAVSTGGGDTCGIRSGRLYCWGFNSSGQLGVGSVEGKSTPTRVGSHSDWSKISLGENTTCGVRNGHEYCWGNNSDGQLGSGANTSEKDTPQRVGPTLDAWSATAVGNYHACGISAKHALRCWGYGGNGQLGNGSTSNFATPKRESLSHTDWSRVTAGERFTCAVRSNHALYCWGDNSEGQLGLGDSNDRTSPQHVA